MNDEVRARHQEDRDDARNGEATEDGAGQRRVLFAACFYRESHGDEAENRRERRHQNWPQTYLARGDDRLFEFVSLPSELAGELHDQNAVRYDDAGHHQHSHEAHDVDRGSWDEQEENHAGDPRRDREQNDEGINKRGKLCHQDEEHQHDRHDETQRKRLEGVVHAVDSSAHRENGSMRRMHACDNLVYVVADCREALCLWHHVDIEYTSKLIMIDFGGSVDGLDGCDRFEWSSHLAVGRSQRDLLEVVEGLNLSLRILDREHVVVPGLRINPVTRSDHAIRRHGCDDAIDNRLWGETFEACLLTV